ncbi:MAG: ABC transporter permease [Treponema sp.]|jgi:ribose transport system permease protein|nr:ABC transporter permease [Treponema sp.]
MDKIGSNKRLGRFLFSQPVILLAFVIIIGAVTTTINPKFITWTNISSIISQSTSLGLVAAGMTILIISGHFDISVGNMIGFTTCVMAILINKEVNSFAVSVLAIALCVACSLLNGGMSILFRAPSFIVTLATSSLFYGAALILTKGYMQTLYGKYRFLASYRLFGLIPFLFLILFAGFLLVYLMIKHTRTGREIFAIGTNENAAYLSGINVNRSKLKFFAISGVLVGFACMVLLSRISGAQATTGKGMELQAIGAVVIGGSSINGGKGGVIGTLFGVILLSMISNAINMLHISAYYQDIVYALVILIALAITALRNVLIERQEG